MKTAELQEYGVKLVVTYRYVKQSNLFAVLCAQHLERRLKQRALHNRCNNMWPLTIQDVAGDAIERYLRETEAPAGEIERSETCKPS